MSPGAPLIRIEDLKKVYIMGENEVHALRGVSLEIRSGEFVAVMGSSGSGKSTLMNVLGALDRPTSGRYWLDGADVSELSRDDRADLRNRKLGFVFQSFNLLSRTSALENVELPLLYGEWMPAADRRARARECLERVGLGKREDHHPSQLSGGQQQRVAIARALVNKPSLILADEPTGNLDSATTAEIMHLLTKLNDEGITIVMVTHELDVSAFAKRRIIFRDGQILEDDRSGRKAAA